MAHDSWAISAFHGEAQNQPGRLTKRPDVVVGDFDRIGGVSPLKYMHDPVLLREEPIGYDWLGISAVRHYGSNNATLRDAQVGSAGTFTVTDWVNAHYRFYAPGGGIYSLDEHDTNDVYVPESAVVLPDGTFYHTGEWGSSWEPTVDVISDSSSTLSSDVELLVALIYFRKSPHGLVPVAIKYDHARTTSSQQAFRVTCPTGYLPEGFVVQGYMQLIPFVSADKWYRFYAGSMGGCRSHYIRSNDAVTYNARPIFYGAPYGTSYYSSQYTLASGRVFYIAAQVNMAFGISGVYVGSGSNLRLRLRPYTAATDQRYGRQHVFYTDPGHLAFSDDKFGPLVLRFDDRIMAISPSVRGIYAFSEVGTWEAYGDFATANGTRITLVPTLGGVDDDKPKVAFSGDTAYFVKEGIVHSIGPGGVKQIGRPVFLNRPHDVDTIWYDRFARRLLATFHDVVAVYDPNTDSWSRWPFTVFPWGLNKYVFNIADGDWWVNDHEVVATDALPTGETYPDIEVEFRKLDFGLPDLRKRLHVITVAYDGGYEDAAIFIRPNGAGSWLPCNVLDNDGYFEARCPTPTFTHLDVRLVVTTTDRDFALNPPLVFTYTKRGKKYHAR